MKTSIPADNMNMEDTEFLPQLQEAITQKTEWFNSDALEKLLLQYRLIHSCVRNLYDMLIKRSLIESDPYRLDKHITDITLPDTSPFPDSEIFSNIGKRFSEYETMLDYICTYVRFSVDSLPIPTVKKLLDFAKVFEWEDVIISSSNSNAHGLAVTLNNARNGAAPVVQSMINDSINKCAQASAEIKKILNELESNGNEKVSAPVTKTRTETNVSEMQTPSLFSSQLAEQIAKIDVNILTPIEALNTLYSLQSQAKKEIGSNS